MEITNELLTEKLYIVFKFLRALFEHKSNQKLISLLDNILKWEIFFSGYNSYYDTDVCDIILYVSPEFYLSIYDDLKDFSFELKEFLSTELRNELDYPINVDELKIRKLDKTKILVNDGKSDDLYKIWGQDLKCPKVFISHKTSEKVKAAEIKKYLRNSYNISSFVAHEDIHVSDEWLRIIEIALQSCDLLLVLLSKDFHDSYWTDQEIGIALGLNKIIVTLIIDKTEIYGFFAKFQAEDLKPDIDQSCLTIRNALFDKSNKSEKVNMLLCELEKVNTSDQANRIAKHLKELLPLINESTISRIRQATAKNNQVENALDVISIIKEYESNTQEIPFS